MSSSPLYKQALNGIALALLAMIQPAAADDEFNLRILEWILRWKIPPR
jgi:outer membrane usher protein